MKLTIIKNDKKGF